MIVEVSCQLAMATGRSFTGIESELWFNDSACTR